MKLIGPVIGIILIVLLAGTYLTGIHTARTIEYSQTVPLITTAAGITSHNATLFKNLFDDDIVSVLSISSNNTGEVPAATSYISALKQLTIDGLLESQTRTLVVTYEYQRMDSSTDTFWGLMPLLFIIGLVALVVLAFLHGRR